MKKLKNYFSKISDRQKNMGIQTGYFISNLLITFLAVVLAAVSFALIPFWSIFAVLLMGWWISLAVVHALATASALIRLLKLLFT